MPYVDGFVLAVPKANIEAYKAMATTENTTPYSDGKLTTGMLLAAVTSATPR